MIKVKPFKGLRPKRELYGEVVSEPYDVLTDEEYREKAEKNPNSFIHIIRAEVDFPEDENPYSEEVYRKGRENLENFMAKGVLVQDDEPSFYAYKQKMGEHSQIGFVAGVSIYDYDNGLVKKHENTRQDKEEDRIKHISTLNAHTGPSFLVYRTKESIDTILERTMESEPEISITTDDGIQHELWRLDDKNLVNQIINEFKSVDALYIADGHHRTKAGVEVGLRKNSDPADEAEHQYFMSVIFPDKMLKILPYNRAIKELSNMSKEEFLDKIGEKFDIEKISGDDQGGYTPEEPKTIGMYIDKQWYKLKSKPEVLSDDPVRGLDVSILQDNILAPLLGIDDPRTSKKISFIGGIRGTKYLRELVDNGKYEVVFSMYPTTMEELLSVADANKLMPPKSTWFEPKLRSGMVVHLLD